MNFARIKRLFAQIQVIRSPKHRLSTFGLSKVHYCLVTDVDGFTDRSRLRTGNVVAEKPAIITPDQLKDKFHGFGESADKYADWLVSQYGQALKGLSYQFRNENKSSKIELIQPKELISRLSDEFDRKSELRTALLQGTDRLWELSIMKFIVEETLASFHSNVQELDDRGFFEGEDRLEKQKHREIRSLFQKATHDPRLLVDLGKKLEEYGLFEQYQDQFFRLVRR